MNILKKTITFWDSVSDKKNFTHPVPVPELKKILSSKNRILDYGCGYGRAISELSSAGFDNIFGVDISEKMITRCQLHNPGAGLLIFDGLSLPFPDRSFNACLFMAVLNCIPSDNDQQKSAAEILRVMKPGGILFISDYPIQEDSRNQKRYRQFRDEFESFGMFRINNGTVFRHSDIQRIYRIFSGFELITESHLKVLTMNGNPADIFQILLRKK